MGNWTPNTVPNSSSANVTVTNATNNPVLIDIAPTIANLQVGAVNSVSLNNGESLTITGGAGAGSLDIAGTLTVGSTGSLTDMILGGTSASTITLSGGGTLQLSNSFNNRVYSTAGNTLTNNAGNTIQGAGQLGINNGGFGFVLNNAGTINANQSSALQVAPSHTVTNTGTLEATAGGTLNLIATVTNTGGTIQATGASSVVELSGSTITGGTLTTSGGGAVQNSGSATLNGVTISSGGTVTAVNGSGTTLMGTINLAPTATLAQNSTGSFTDLHISGTVELAGGGTLTLSNNFNNRIFATGSDTLINDASNTIQGSGQLGINNGGFAFNLNNKGTINANQSSALQVAPSNTVTNTGTLEATAGATLNLIATVTNTGTIQATGASSVVEVNGSTINGGTLTTSGGGTVQNSGTATLNGVSISNSSTVTAVNGSSTTLQGTITINPTGTLAQNSTGSFTDLHISGTVELAGGGTLTLSNNFNNRIFATGSDTLINDASNTIQGSGQLGINNGGFAFNLNNKGTINANQGSALQVAPSNTVTNTGTLEATSGGTLNLTGGTFNNTGGLIQATGSGSVVDFSGSTISGGTLTTSSGGTIQNNNTATLDGTTNSPTISSGSAVTLLNGTSTTLMGTITNDGTLAQNSTGSFTDLHVSGTVTLSGNGSLTLSNSFNNRVFALGSDSLINDVNHTIQGSGQFGINNGGFAFTLTNKGTINANQSAVLQVAPSNTVTNTGTLEATAGGTLNLTGGTFNNTGGLILATGSSSVVDFSGSTISGGTLTTQSGGTIQNSNTATLDGTTNSPTISSGSTVTLLNGTSITLMGTIINNGTLAQNSTGSFTDLHISGNVTLTGNGSLTLSNSFNNRVFASGSDSLTNDVNHTIQGGGQLGINNGGFAFTLTNNGTIIANQSTQLQIAPGSTTNNGTFQVASGSLMNVIGTFTNFAVDTLTGGTYVVAGTLQFPGANIVNNAANITLTGAASTIVNESSVNGIDNIFANNLAVGSFTIQNGRNFTSAPSFSNAGAVNIGTGTTFTAASAYTQSGGTTQVDGTLSAPGVAVNAGLLKGTGTVTGNVTVGTGAGPGAVISPGDSPGTLTIQSALSLNSDATYKFELNSSSAIADKIVANGVTINAAKFSFTDLGSGALTLGMSFVIIDNTSSSRINGVFSNLADNSTFSNNGNTYVVSYEGGTGNDLTLTVGVPEPGAIALIFLGCGVLFAGRIRRS